MSKKTAIILGASLLAIPVGGYAYFKHIERNLEFAFSGIHINGTQNAILDLDISFEVASKIGMKFTVMTTDINIYTNGSLVGTAAQQFPVVVPNRTRAILTVNSKIDLRGVGTSLYSVLLGAVGVGSKGVTVNIRGFATIRVDIPLFNKFNITVPIDEVYAL